MRSLRAVALMAVCGASHCADLSYQVVEAFSNADGTVQFVQLRETGGRNGQQGLAGKSLTVTHDGRTKTFAFPSDLPSADTANRSVLVVTPGFLAVPGRYPEYKAVTPDYVAFDQLLPAAGGTIDFAGTDQWTFGPLPRDGFSAVYRSGNPVRDNTVQNFGGASVSLPVVPVTAFEYYNAALDHYFVTDLAPDIDALDTSRIPGWARTGKSFQVWPIASGFLNDVCRYYIPPEHGNSHFFSASKAECAAIASRVGVDPNYSGYVLETAEAFAVALPDAAGSCANNWTAVYRLWNNRPDSNHRYTTDPAVKAQMLARGYVAEGYGPDAVGMCVPLSIP